MPDQVSLQALAFIAVVLLQRLGELWLANRNTRRLLARGGREIGASHYPLIVALHAAWLIAIAALGWNAPVSPPWFAAYVLLQVFRVWILSSLGSRWTTRIIVIDEPLVKRGLYRFIPHPNYALVVAEIITVPMALGLPVVAAIFTVLNAVVLAIRIRAENKGLSEITGR